MLSHPTPQPTPASPSSVVRPPNIPRSAQPNGGNMEHAANTGIAIPLRGLSPFMDIAQYQQLLLANNAGVHIPMVAAPKSIRNRFTDESFQMIPSAVVNSRHRHHGILREQNYGSRKFQIKVADR